MLWIIITVGLLLLICWILLSPMEVYLDTRIPNLSLKWLSIGNAALIYEKEEWLLRVKVIFFRKQWLLEKLFSGSAKKKKPEKVKIRISKTKKFKEGKASAVTWLRRSSKLLPTFQIIEWKIAMDGNDHIRYAMMYPLNFFPGLKNHVHINFEDQTYILLRIRNQLWRIIYAWLK